MEAEHRLAVAQREVARLRQHIRLDGDTIEDLQDQCGALFVRLNEVAVIAARVPTLEAESSVVRQRAGGLAEELARERQRAEQAETTLHGEVERGAHLGLESGKWLRQIDELKGVAQAQAEATRTAEARGDALQLRGDEVARENDQLRAKLDAAETEAARLRAEGDALGARLVAEERRRADIDIGGDSVRDVATGSLPSIYPSIYLSGEQRPRRSAHRGCGRSSMDKPTGLAHSPTLTRRPGRSGACLLRLDAPSRLRTAGLWAPELHLGRLGPQCRSRPPS